MYKTSVVKQRVLENQQLRLPALAPVSQVAMTSFQR